MNVIESQRTLANLFRERAWLMQEYRDCIKRDNIFAIKNKILERIRDIEDDIKKLEGVFQTRTR